MARGRLPMRKIKKVLAFHFDEGRSARAIATHCGLARRSVALVLERFEASGLSWSEARDMDEEALEAALYPPPQEAPTEDVDWSAVEKALSVSGVTLKLLWEEWRETHPDGMSYVTWCRRFRQWRPRRGVTMRQNRRPGERLFVDYAGMTVPLLVDGIDHEAQVFVASMGVSGRLYAEATLTQKIEDWCASHVRCFEDMGWAPQLVVPDNLKPAVTQPSRYEPVLNETYADLLDHYGVQGFPARVRRPRDKGLVEQGVLHAERRILAPLRNHVFHDLASLNRAIAARARKINNRPYADGTGENRYSRFESVDLPHMRPLPDRRWQRTQWRQNTVHPDYHIAVDRHFYSVPYQYVGKEVDVRVRGSVIDVFHRGRQIASHRVWSSVTDQSPPPGVAMSGLVEVCNRNVHTGRWTTRPGCAGSALPAGKMTRFGLACRRQIRPLPWPDIPLGLPRHESQAASVFTGYDRQVWQQSQLRELSTALAPPFRRLRISIAQLAVTWAMTAAA